MAGSVKHRPITQIKHEIDLANKLVSELQRELRAAREAEQDIHVGDIVIGKPYYNSIETEYKVTKIDFWGRDKATLYGCPRLKDGVSWHKRVQYIGDNWRRA